MIVVFFNLYFCIWYIKRFFYNFKKCFIVSFLRSITSKAHFNFIFMNTKNTSKTNTPFLCYIVLKNLMLSKKVMQWFFNTPEIHHEIFLKTMADLLLDKDVLILISSIASERTELARATFLKTCGNTCGVNIRSVSYFQDLRDLKRNNEVLSHLYMIHLNQKKIPKKRCTWCS